MIFIYSSHEAERIGEKMRNHLLTISDVMVVIDGEQMNVLKNRDGEVFRCSKEYLSECFKVPDCFGVASLE